MKDNNPDSSEADDLRKYHQAAYGFLSLSLIYIAISVAFPLPFNLDVWKRVAYALGALVLFGFIYKGSRKLTIVLAAIYALRSVAVVSVYIFVKGQGLTAVPYVLPCFLLTFYVLARAAWKWP